MAIQANLVQLKVADAKRRGIPATEYEIKVRPPGAVHRFRETLIDYKVLGRYSDEQVKLRMHEIWGQYCMMQWLFSLNIETQPVDFSTLPENSEVRCDAAVQTKLAEVHALFWKIRFEQRRRTDHDYVQSPQYTTDQAVASKIPAKLHAKNVADCSDEELLLGACEHAGMLATIRWAGDPRLAWAAPGIMEVKDQPF